MAIGDNFDTRTIKAFDWAQFAHDCALRPRLVAGELERMAIVCRDAVPIVSQAISNESPDLDILLKVKDRICEQCEQALRAAPETKLVDHSLFAR